MVQAAKKNMNEPCFFDLTLVVQICTSSFTQTHSVPEVLGVVCLRQKRCLQRHRRHRRQRSPPSHILRMRERQ
jgi:hypothetical protein